VGHRPHPDLRRWRRQGRLARGLHQAQRPARPPARHTSGRTDPQILLDAFLLAGIDEAHARRLLPAALELEAQALRSKLDELRAKGRAMPGAEAALQALQQQPDVVQSVLTGNVKPNAVLKLQAFGLDSYVDFDVGAYGSDHADRPKLVELAP
jgi:phosphoglycolate phosphatase